MAGPRRKPAVKVAIGAAALGVATSVACVAATQPASISASLVDLTALIVVGSSTHPSGAGVEDFYGRKFRDDPTYTGPDLDDIFHVNFWDGPAGIQAALDANAGEDNAVIASGWGAANTSLLLLRNDTDLSRTVFILDNDVARPDGGFGTRYPLFALIGVNPFPTPSQTGALRVVNTGYEYDYNSNAPGYVLNPFSALNSLASWFTTRLSQDDVDLPVDAQGRPVAPDGSPLDCGANTCAFTDNGAVLACPDARCVSPVGDRISAYVTTRGNTTYVTYTARELPLTTLIRGIFGDYIANVTAPLLKWAVDFGYYGGNPIPSDPSAYRPGRFIPSIGDMLTALVKLPGAILETIAAIFSPFLPRAAQPVSVARQSAPLDEIVGAATDSNPEGLNARQMPITGEGLDAVPGGDHDDGSGDDGTAGVTDSGPEPQDDDQGSGQQTDLSQNQLAGGGTGTETGSRASITNTDTDNTAVDTDTDPDKDVDTDTNAGAETGTATGNGTNTGTTSTGTGTGTSTGTNAGSNDAGSNDAGLNDAGPNDADKNDKDNDNSDAAAA